MVKPCSQKGVASMKLLTMGVWEVRGCFYSGQQKSDLRCTCSYKMESGKQYIWASHSLRNGTTPMSNSMTNDLVVTAHEYIVWWLERD